jgi:outer membrane protein assembly factor BamB
VVDQWGVLNKIDVRSADMGHIVWRMDPGQEKSPLSNRGAALWGNLVVTVANYPARVIVTNKKTGKVAWETNMADGQPNLQLTGASMAIKDKIVLGAAGGDQGSRDGMSPLRRRQPAIGPYAYGPPSRAAPARETLHGLPNALAARDRDATLIERRAKAAQGRYAGRT